MLAVKRSREEWQEVLATITHGYLTYGSRSKMYDSGFGAMARLKALDVWKEGDRILDIACGNGRLAIPLTEVECEYEGMDVIAGSIEWCKKAFDPWADRFKFQHTDIWNGFYNPNGKILPIEFKLDFPDESFNSLIFSSLFTHIGSIDVCRHYLEEAYRLMKHGGMMWVTWFRSPPNEICSGTERTAFFEADIINLIKQFTVTYTNCGFTDAWHDQWEMVLRKE